jgi:hypothetical protein
VWDWLREPNSSRNLRTHGLGGATQKPDGKRPAALRKLPTHNTTGRYTEAVGAQYDRPLYGSCRRTIRPAEPTRTAPRAAALQVEPAKTAPHAAALQGGQRSASASHATKSVLPESRAASASPAANSVLRESRSASASHATKSVLPESRAASASLAANSVL